MPDIIKAETTTPVTVKVFDDGLAPRKHGALVEVEAEGVQVNVYWCTPLDGREPYLVVDVLTDDETNINADETPTNLVVTLNDGDLYRDHKEV